MTIKQSESEKGHIQLELSGRIDTNTSPELRESVSKISDDVISVCFDLREVEYVSSAGLREFLICRKRYPDDKMKMINVNPSVYEIFVTTGFDTLLPIEHSDTDISSYVHLSFTRFLDRKIEEMPDAPAVCDDDRTYTFLDIERGSQIIAHDLAKLGIGRGDHVGLYAVNGIRWIMTFFAIRKLDALAMLINPQLSDRELDTLIDIADIKYLCTSKEGSDKTVNYLIGEGPGITERFRDYESVKGLYASRAESDDPAVVIFTSGSTGRPKGVLLSSYNILNAASASALDQTLTSDDRTCLILPLFHVFGLVAGLFANMIAGSVLVIPKDIRTGTLLKVIEEKKCTFFHSVPTMLLALLNNSDFSPEKMASLRGTIISGAAATPAQIELFQKMMPNNNFFSSYGLSEMAPVSTTHYGDTHEHITKTVGMPVSNISIRIENGEILVQGFNLMIGYYKVPIEDQAIDEDGWLHTGDLGFIDEEGYLHLSGRRKELIIRGGENIMPGEVENAISKLDGIAMVKVIGVPDDFFGEEVVACIRLQDGAYFDEGIAKQVLGQELAKFKIPSRFLIMDEMPMLATGKIDGVTLKEQVVNALQKKE